MASSKEYLTFVSKSQRVSYSVLYSSILEIGISQLGGRRYSKNIFTIVLDDGESVWEIMY